VPVVCADDLIGRSQPQRSPSRGNNAWAANGASPPPTGRSDALAPRVYKSVGMSVPLSEDELQRQRRRKARHRAALDGSWDSPSAAAHRQLIADKLAQLLQPVRVCSFRVVCPRAVV
jgi:hypothetical protein